jgi:hypothetical protein
MSFEAASELSVPTVSVTSLLVTLIHFLAMFVVGIARLAVSLDVAMVFFFFFSLSISLCSV